MNPFRWLREIVQRLLDRLFGRAEARSGEILAGEVFDLPGEAEEEPMHIEKSMTVLQGFALTPRFLRSDGSEAQVDGVPTWEHTALETAPFLAITVAEGGMQAIVSSIDRETVGSGTFEVTVRADADLDAGEYREVVCHATVTVNVIPAEAVAGEIVAGDVVEIPPPGSDTATEQPEG